MKYIKNIFTLVVVLAVVSGCASKNSYDYSRFRQSKPRSIVVIPPVNKSVEVNAPYIYLSTITKPLAEKGYYVYPVSVIDHFLKENGLPTPAEMNSIPLDKIRKHIGADAVLYVSIENWGQKYHVISSQAVVNISLRLVDTRTSELLWDGKAHAVQSSSDGGGGIAGMLISAVVTQVVGSLVDHTPELSKTANNKAASQLLDGPYKNTSGSFR